MIPSGVRTALARAPLGMPCCRRAELATTVALRGEWHPATAQVALVIDVPTAAAAERLCRLLRGQAPDAQVLLATPTPGTGPGPGPGPGHRPPPTETPPTSPSSSLGWTVITRPATTLARQTGLLTRHGQPLLGLPAPVLRGQNCCATAAWRAALLTIPTPSDPARPDPARPDPGPVQGPPGLAVDCPNPVIGLALLGLARRLGAHARIHTRDHHDYAHLATDHDITAVLTAAAGPAAAAAFPPLTQPALQRAPQRRSSGSTTANTAKARRAAAATVAQVTAAFTVLGSDHPGLTTELREAGRLRLAHPELSLTDLAARAQPPLTKDTLHGRIRRLLALAERHHNTATAIPRAG